MSAWIMDTIPGKKKRSGQDKSIQDWKEEDTQQTQDGLNTQSGKKTSSSAAKSGFSFEEWPNEQENKGNRSGTAVSQTPVVRFPTTWEPEYKARDRLVSTHQSGKFNSHSGQPVTGSISGASEELGNTGWTGRQRTGWSTDDLFPRETVEAAKLPETYRSIPEASDYRENSQYVPTGSGKKGMTWQEALLGQWLDTGYDDPMYEYVNGNTDAINKRFSMRASTATHC